MSIVVVTGTGTGVGKTIATAALTAAVTAAGKRVAVVKPTQTGATDDEPGDVAVVGELTGCASLHELLRLDDPLAPDTAARLRGLLLPPVASLVPRILEIVGGHDVTVVEGAGGVAVRLDTSGGTILTLTRHLAEAGHAPRVVVVTTIALGTLNHTELTVDAVRSAGLEPAGLILGSVPARLGLAERCNLDELPRVTGLPVLARLPAGAGGWDPARFRAEAVGWLRLDRLLAPADGY
ncbi:MAG: dethiobiotin synthase [Nocardioidaceae bacterium]|nr:dethiobiotin synthase [Nocardioidaceae bacterium]